MYSRAKQVYQGHVNSLKETIIETFKNVLAVNVKQQLKPLPSDGTVHPVTSFVISYLGISTIFMCHKKEFCCIFLTILSQYDRI